MKNSRHLKLAAVLAGALALSNMNGPAGAEESVAPIDPGFKPDTGQINSGVAQQSPSQSKEVIEIPTPEESRRALMTPISKQPSLGSAPDSSSSNAGGQPASETMGRGSSASSEPPPSGPIGSVGETLPAKFSERNDILDRTPIMALPLPLSDQQRRQIYEAIMADKTQPDAGADALKPASQLSTNQALNEMHPLPTSVSGIDGVTRLQYVKSKNKVLLVEPATRTVVEQITP
jgi:hypothetical protein